MMMMMMMMKTDYANEVTAGLALLDEKLEVGWDRRVDLDRLDMRSDRDCVAAQALGVPFHKTWPTLGITVRNGHADYAELQRHGLVPAPADHSLSERLTVAWRAALEARRAERVGRDTVGTETTESDS